MNTEKPKLHKSSLAMHERCPRQYMYRYVEGIIIPPASAMILGSSVHASSAKDLTAKRDTGELLREEEVKAAAATAVNFEWDKTGVVLDDEEKLLGEKRVRGETVDAAVGLAKLHHKELAPTIAPKHIERPFTVEMKGFPVDLSGTLDLQESNGTLRDLKTRSASPPAGLADSSLDLSFYGLAAKALDGKAPDKLALDCLVKNKTPKVVTQYTTRHEAAYRALLLRIEAVSKAIESGAFPPCASESFTCCARYCGYYTDLCPWGSKARVVG